MLRDLSSSEEERQSNRGSTKRSVFASDSSEGEQSFQDGVNKSGFSSDSESNDARSGTSKNTHMSGSNTSRPGSRHSENSKNDLSLEDENLIDDLLEGEKDAEDISQGHANRQPFSQQSTTSMDDAIGQQSMLEDHDCPVYLRSAFQRTHVNLYNKGVYKYNLPMETVEDTNKLLTMNPEHEITMDSASKCFRVIPNGDLSRYVQPYEGYYLCYMARCNSMSLPDHVVDVLYFYHELLSHLKTYGLTNYSIPLTNQELHRNMKVREKTVLGFTETIVASEAHFDGLPEPRTGMISIVQTLNDRDVQRCSDHVQDREPFTIRVAFTGAMFDVVSNKETDEEESKSGQELFCVVIITPNAAFNLALYVKDMFNSPPRNPNAKEHWAQLHMCYKSIQMYEVNHNCGLFCDPSKYDNDLGGKGGIFSVLSMLNLPYRMTWLIMKQLEKEQDVRNLRIIGLPSMSYSKDGTMNQYEKYMHKYITEQAELHNKCLYHLQVFNTAPDAEQGDMKFELPSPGGWPLKYVEDKDGYHCYLRFGLFNFPIVMSVTDPRFVERMTRESFKINLGGLPFSVEKKIRDFKTFDPDSRGVGMIPDAQMLLENQLQTPLNIMKKYYGDGAQPAEEFMDNRLVKWFEAMKDHIQTLRQSGEMTPEDAMAQINTHMESCLEQHRCTLDGDGYGSHHLAQCRQITKDVSKTKLDDVSMEALLLFNIENEVPESIRHDAYLSTSYTMMHQWYEYNKDARLNATNAEAAVEIMLASLLWVLGSHHHSIVPFFQGVLIMSNRGHNEMLIDKQYYVDWRKPNSSGAGCIQDRLNKYLEELGLQYKIMKGKDNKIVFINPNRNTDVALEQESCVVTVTIGGAPQVQSRPSPEFKYMPLLMLELRGSASLAALIWLIFRRDPAARNFITTTIDPKNSNERLVAKKEQVAHPCVSGMCTNQKRGTDEPKTIICVTHVCDPGAPAYKPIEEHGTEFNQVKCDLNDGRAKMPNKEKLLVLLKSLFFSHTFAKVDVAMLHLSGAFPYRISFVTASALDWFYMLVKEHLFCIFNPNMVENFGRIRVSDFFCGLFFLS